jgi:nucleoside-diphosphate-sugar epimerase
MPRALVTGGSGFLGLHLCTALERAGYEVRSLDLAEPPPGVPPEREQVRADVRDAQALPSAAQGCDVVVDNAALVPVTRASASEYRSVNVDGCRNTLAAAREAGAYAVHISSSAIFGVPRDLPVRPDTALAPFEPYGRSKAEADRLVEERRREGQAVASLRPRTLLGAGRLGLFDVIFSRVQAGKAVPIFGRGHNRVQMCDVEDFCTAALAAIERRANGDYNIGATRFASVREDLEGLIAHAGTGAGLLPVPVAAIKAVLVPLDAVGRSPFGEWHWRSAPKPFYFDVTKAREELGWEPRRSNVEALANAYHHYLNREGAGGSAHLRPLRGGLARLLRG